LEKQDKRYRTAFVLALFTIIYNVAEGLIATYLVFKTVPFSIFRERPSKDPSGQCGRHV
jgi:zinc transporter ZupT